MLGKCFGAKNDICNCGKIACGWCPLYIFGGYLVKINM
ncbi:hypothetical protein PORCRE_424 [Porphyromonas crevioricanis JCM 15906]|uniref:Uncharacterized protein n=1 Tax=Porphyromonas crevioricanis JCM 15906 TaxID=1305617 RepID=S4N6U1_9PORP|nr:hypothetical protein PORCRE_424 [Porphyromonas crevioricanis JCM 15906]GAD08064.1 hypothetical protein PORCAN_1698 [Porphyromonas crevioricanis JCM 13913]